LDRTNRRIQVAALVFRVCRYNILTKP
jgi:hypothetical protein